MAAYDSVTKAFASLDRGDDGCGQHAGGHAAVRLVRCRRLTCACNAGRFIETSDLAALCSSLGEPLSHSELEEAVQVLDPADSGRIAQVGAPPAAHRWQCRMDNLIVLLRCVCLYVWGCCVGSQEDFMAWWERVVGEAGLSPRARSIASPGGHSGGGRDDASADGSQGGKKLTVVRHLRKQAQNDAQLLINRIALLRVRAAFRLFEPFRAWCR